MTQEVLRVVALRNLAGPSGSLLACQGSRVTRSLPEFPGHPRASLSIPGLLGPPRVSSGLPGPPRASPGLLKLPWAFPGLSGPELELSLGVPLPPGALACIEEYIYKPMHVGRHRTVLEGRLFSRKTDLPQPSGGACQSKRPADFICIYIHDAICCGCNLTSATTAARLRMCRNMCQHLSRLWKT